VLRALQTLLRKLGSDYGILLALAALCGFFAWVTHTEQHPTGAAGGLQLAREIGTRFPPGGRVLIAVRETQEDREFAAALADALTASGFRVVETVRGQPAQARAALERQAAAGGLEVIAVNQTSAAWTVFDDLPTRFPPLAGARVAAPTSYRGSNFLKRENLLNIANQIAVIAIVAIGMTLVILTGGIDLSVGSLIALSAVVSTLLIRDAAGGEQAGAGGMVLACAAGVGACGLLGLITGGLVTALRIPPFIVTLAMMLVASGLAFLAARGQSVYQVPDSFVWLGRGSDLGLPRAVWLTGILYALAHILLARTRAGRYVYAVGSNETAARLSGVPVGRTLLWVYAACGALAGLGGVVMASQLKSGAPTYGGMYELYVIAAVVVGGTSLAGGRGHVLGTLLGALLIAVIQNGMNLTGVESYTQKVVLGLVILGAVMLDMWRRRSG
jgi:ribose transport system permease protein